MTRIDDVARAPKCDCYPSETSANQARPEHGTFKKILESIAVVASSVVPGLPVVGAISNVFKKSSDLDVGRLTGSSEALHYLELQRAIEIETRAFETASNVMKARHDAHMNSIRNLRS